MGDEQDRRPSVVASETFVAMRAEGDVYCKVTATEHRLVAGRYRASSEENRMRSGLSGTEARTSRMGPSQGAAPGASEAVIRFARSRVRRV